MYKLSKIILISFIAILGASALGVSCAQANGNDDLVVEFEQTPLFGEANFLPGDSVVRWAKVTNNSGENENILVETIEYIGFSNPNNVPADDLSRALSIVIREQGGNDLYGGTTGAKTLYNLFEEGETLLTPDLAGNGGQIIYDFEISFSIEKADEWQAKTTQFDILLGFPGQEGGDPTPPSPPLPPCVSSGSGGTPVPGLTIIKNPEITFDPNDPDNDATITWTTSYHSTSQVIYSIAGNPPTPEEGHEFKFNEPYYGYAHAYPDPEDFTKIVNHIIVIPDLLPGRTYYYRVVSYASPPTISREYTFTVPGVKGAATGQGVGQGQSGQVGQLDGQGLREIREKIQSIGGKIVQGIYSVLGQESQQEESQQGQEQDKEILSLDVLDDLGLSNDEQADASEKVSEEIEGKNFSFNLTANLFPAFSAFFDTLKESVILVIAIIFFVLLLIIAGVKFIKDRKEKK